MNTPLVTTTNQLNPPNNHAVLLDLKLSLIDEDPCQPRTETNPGFSTDSLEELAASIALRGVKTPISVRENIDAPGRFIINHGARRYRASRRAGKISIPAFIDNDYNEADQVVENLQRNALTAREIADYIGRELSKGIKKRDIAKAISKSPAFISQHVTLLDLPEPIAQVFNTGRVKDVTVINELVMAFKKAPGDVSYWLNDKDQEITRGSVKLLRTIVESSSMEENTDDWDKDVYAPISEQAQVAASSTNTDIPYASPQQIPPVLEEKQDDPQKIKKAIIRVRHNNRPARLLLNRRPHAEGFAWLRYEDDGEEFASHLEEVKLIALLEG